MLNFNQFVNESKDHEFDSIKKGDTIRWVGAKYTVKKAGDGIIIIKGHSKDIRINKGMWKQKSGEIIKTQDEK
jgi:hypothetical protein